MDERYVVILAGPNGAGKTTASATVLPGLGIPHFVNADTIARGLCGFAPESVSMDAARIMLGRLKQLAASNGSFSFETTLATRSFAPWLRTLHDQGYRIAVLYMWLPDPEMNVQRVAQRVRCGGHFVPEQTVHRRYEGGLRNFFHLYRPLADEWRFYDSSGEPRLIASNRAVEDPGLWSRLEGEYGTSD